MSRRFLPQLAIAVDDIGTAHIVGGSDEGIVYITNRNGSWDEQLISRAPRAGADGQPSIALDSDGSIWVAFTRVARSGCSRECGEGDIVLMSGGPDDWATALVVAHGGSRPSLDVRDGIAHLVYRNSSERGDVVSYTTGSAGSWTDYLVARETDTPTVHVTSTGATLICMADYDDATGDFILLHTVAPDRNTEVSLQRGPLLPFNLWPVFDSALDSQDRLHIVGAAGHQLWAGDTWTDPVPILDPMIPGVQATVQPGAVAVDQAAVVHVVSYNAFDSDGGGLWYAENSAGAFQTHVVLPAGGWYAEDGPYGASDIDVDAAGRPHVVFNVLRDEQEGIWYARGTGTAR